MAPPVTAPTRPTCPAQTLAEHIAQQMPARTGTPWTVQPYTAWWTTQSAARLTQHDRALILTTHTQRTQIGWQLPNREPYQPNLDIEHTAPDSIAREILRLILPVMDDEAAAHPHHRAPRTMDRRELLTEIRHAVRLHGIATHDRAGLQPDSTTLSWSTPAGLRYSVTLYGTNPACDVTLNGPLQATLRAVPHFLPHPPATPRHPLEGIRGRLARRIAGHLTQFTDVDQLDNGGLTIGRDKGPYGYVAPALDPTARTHDHTPVSVRLHGVGIDLLLSHTAQLAH